MNSFFSKILKLAMTGTTEQPFLAIVATSIDREVRNADKPLGTFEFPRANLPSTSEVRSIPDDDKFLQELQRAISETKLTRVFLVPPFCTHRFLPDDLRQRFPRMNYEDIVLQLATDCLPKGATIGILLPAFFFQAQGNRSFRASVFGRSSPKLVITHSHSFVPFGTGLHHSFRIGTLILEKEADNRLLRFFKSPDPSSPHVKQGILEDLERLLKQGGGQTTFGYVIREGLPPDAPLLHDLYDPTIVGKQKSLGEIGSLSHLSSIADIRVGISPIPGNLLLAGDSREGVPLIDGRNIGSTNQFDMETIRHRANVPPERQLKEGDLCLRSIIGHGDDRLHMAEVTKDILPAAPGNHVVVVRAKPELTLEERQVLIAYLRSPHAAEQLAVRRGQTLHLTASHLSELPVPVLDETLRVALSEVDESIRYFREWICEAERAQNALFEFARPKEARIELLSMGRLSRQRCESAKLVTDLHHRIRTRFPHPIAFRWRTVESSHPNLEGYQNVLECAEVAVCYLACMAFLIGRVLPDFRINYFSEIAKRMNTSKPHGTNMGDWVAVVREARASKAIRNSSELVPFSEMAFIDNDTDEILQKLSDYRNDLSHGRGPKGAKVKNSFEESKELLESFLEGIEFVAEYPLRYVEKAKHDTLGQQTECLYRELMGDHPLVPLTSAIINFTGIEEESLYLSDRNGRLFLLRPLLTFLECPECGRLSVFYLDNYKKKEKACVLKSMENGHTVEDQRITVAFQQVGLIPTG